jgi:heptosyltransferase-2
MKLLVFCPNWIGDAVMATPALRALRDTFARAHLVGVLKPYVAGALEGGPWFDELVFLDSRGPSEWRWPAVAARLRRLRPEVAVLLNNTFRSALVARIAGCRRRIGYVRHGRGWLLTDRLYLLQDARGRLLPSPVIDAYNALAQHAGCPAPSYCMELFTTPNDDESAATVWEAGRLALYSEVVCLNPGAAFGSAKYWPAESFAELARELADRRGSGVLILCGPAERELARKIVALTERPGVISLADFPTSLGLTKACVRQADLLITTDSGPRHFAAAFNRPVVTLFGPTHIAWTETYYSRAVHLQKEVPCGPCQQRVCPLDHRCMKELRPAEVFAAAVRLLAVRKRFPAA